jgi:pseudaminic acid synthase
MKKRKNNEDGIWERITRKDHCFIIAEAGSNHNGSLKIAKKLVDIACEAKADAVKFQFFEADKIAADTTHKIAKLDNGKTLHQFYKTCETPRHWISDLIKYCKKKKILFFATPFDEDAVDYLEKFNAELYKIASFEIVHIPLLKKIAKTGKPVILSSGMADIEDIQDALKAIYEEGNKKVIVLHCGINYPVPFDDVNLRAMDTIKNKFNIPVGYSDHTSGITVPIAAVARGAQVIEKHFTISRKMKGPDHSFAIEPDELKEMVKSIRECETSLGKPTKKHTKNEIIHYKRGRRSIFAAKDIKKGEVLTMNHFSILRPGVGLKPKFVYELIGKVSKNDLKKNTPIDWGIIK